MLFYVDKIHNSTLRKTFYMCRYIDAGVRFVSCKGSGVFTRARGKVSSGEGVGPGLVK